MAADAGAMGQGDKGKLHVRVGLAFVQTLRPALYALLVASFVLAFWAGGEIAGRRMPTWAARGAPTLFGIFLVVFAFYRLALVRARRYPAATGLFQIGLGALVWVLLLPGTRQRIAGPEAGVVRPSDDVNDLLFSADPRVRALAAEVAGSRSVGQAYAAGLIDHLTDPDARVRAASRAALVRLFGTDPAAGLPDDAAAARFREEASARGWLVH